ncbi:hypothetical protein QLX08_004941 [Tetragonisca angustula]|uniref:Uncharacterized protein n=1 Tax=Tetragonisca angustula TaxID=166442 RepID=A0AAW1A013_9HYME
MKSANYGFQLFYYFQLLNLATITCICRVIHRVVYYSIKDEDKLKKMDMVDGRDSGLNYCRRQIVNEITERISDSAAGGLMRTRSIISCENSLPVNTD